jgi:Peptidase family M1 domain
MRSACAPVILAVLLTLATPVFSQTSPSKSAAHATAESPEANKPLSTRVVAYEIDAKLDPARHTITASETLTYKNLTGQPQQTFPFHLYMNAFQPESTFMTEVRLYGTRGAGPDLEWDAKQYGSITVEKLLVEGMGDLTGKMEFIQPDDHNTNDHTVFQITLPEPVSPGASVQFRMDFHEQLPKVVERTGYVHDFEMVGQWFPKVGVWWKNAWNCHQFHATTEFFADFGTFDVKITLPQSEIVGAGGDMLSTVNNSDGTKTVTYHSEDVHDFSWAASPSFTVIEDSWSGSQGPVQIQVLMSPGHMPSASRYVAALKGSLRLFDQWYGPYPYDRITLVDPPHGGDDAGGMEYPTLITAGTTWYMPNGFLAPEIVVEHEFGHQYWYGMVATNEFEDAWLDEGINSYSEVKVMDALYGRNTSAINFPFAQAGEAQYQRTGYLADPDMDPISRFAWQFINSDSYGSITYGKTATMLLTLEKVIGEDTLRNALHTYFMRYRFAHPTGEDFLKTIEEVSGRDLRWYFNQAVYGTNELDYAVSAAHSDPLKWWEQKRHYRAGPSKDEVYRTYVIVERKREFIFPVDLEVKFDDGFTATEHWNGQDRWVRYQYDRQAKIVSAEIDPRHQVLLDRDNFNDSYLTEPNPTAVYKLRNIWMFGAEWLSQLLAWLT